MKNIITVLLASFFVSIAMPAVSMAQTSNADISAPVISVTSEPKGKDMNIVLNSNEEGDVVFGGACAILSAYAKQGSNKIGLYELRAGEYTDCTVLVVDAVGNESNVVALDSFTRKAFESVNHASGLFGANVAGLFEDTNKENTNPVQGEVLGSEKFVFTMFLKVGSHNTVSKVNEIKELQKFLNAKNLGTLVMDGKFGPMTKNSVVKFQLAKGLIEDGQVGPLTRKYLNE